MALSFRYKVPQFPVIKICWEGECTPASADRSYLILAGYAMGERVRARGFNHRPPSPSWMLTVKDGGRTVWWKRGFPCEFESVGTPARSPRMCPRAEAKPHGDSPRGFAAELLCSPHSLCAGRSFFDKVFELPEDSKFSRAQGETPSPALPPLWAGRPSQETFCG